VQPSIGNRNGKGKWGSGKVDMVFDPRNKVVTMMNSIRNMKWRGGES